MYTELCQVINSHKNFVVISHFRPDGDAIGSTLALGLTLRALGKQVQLWNEDPCPARYTFLQGSELLQAIPPALPQEVDCFICVDTGDLKRIGDAAMARFKEAPYTVNIDHHHTNTNYADLNVVKGGEAACGCMIAELITALGAPLTRPVAEALYAAISTDTGSFQYGSTTPQVMRTTASLIEAGVDVGDINRRIWQESPMSVYTMQKEVLNHMVIEENGALTHYSMPAGKKAELGVGMEDCKDLVDYIRIWEGVKAAVIFEDMENGMIRVSLRSKDPRIDVSSIAGEHGGGGHSMASGIRMRGTLEDCREKVLNSFRRELRKLS